MASTLGGGTAAASPELTGGVSVGRIAEERVDADKDAIGLWLRIALGPQAWLQGELMRANDDLERETGTWRSGRAFIGVDLSRGTSLVPVVFAGAGLDRTRQPSGDREDGHHIEAGAGLEYRAVNGLFIGGSARLGERTTPPQEIMCINGPCPGIAIPAPSGRYHAVRIDVGVRF